MGASLIPGANDGKSFVTIGRPGAVGNEIDGAGAGGEV